MNYSTLVTGIASIATQFSTELLAASTAIVALGGLAVTFKWGKRIANRFMNPKGA